MKASVAGSEQQFVFGKRFFWALPVFTIYFGLALIPEWWPTFGLTTAFFIYSLTVPVVMLALTAVACWGLLGMLIAKWSKYQPGDAQRGIPLVSLTGCVLFALSKVLSHFIVGDLPTGSFTLRFDIGGWQESKSAEYVVGDITPRQKMLGDVVSHILPGHNRTEIERLLGPSLQTSYFAETDRDLIYVLGPQRNSIFAIDSEWLLVWLDKSGQFQRYAIYTD